MYKIAFVIATNEHEFAQSLESILYSEAMSILHDDTKYVTMQFSKAPEAMIWDKVVSYMRTDGQYVFNGEFVRNTDIYHAIEPYCKQVRFDIVPVEVKKIPKAVVMEVER